MFGRRRGILEIYYDFLVYADNKQVAKTAFQNCGKYTLHYSTIKNVVDALVSNGLMNKIEMEGDNKTPYRFETSDKGKMFMSYFRKVIKLVDI